MKRPIFPRRESHEDWVARMRKQALEEGEATAAAKQEFEKLVNPSTPPDNNSQPSQPS